MALSGAPNRAPNKNLSSKNQAAPFFLRGRLLRNRQVSGGTAGSRILWLMALFAKSALSNCKPHIQTKKTIIWEGVHHFASTDDKRITKG